MIIPENEHTPKNSKHYQIDITFDTINHFILKISEHHCFDLICYDVTGYHLGKSIRKLVCSLDFKDYIKVDTIIRFISKMKKVSFFQKKWSNNKY